MFNNPEIDVADPRFKADSYVLYAWLRAEAPVCGVRMGRWYSAWMITRYDDVVAVLKDERFAKDSRKAPITLREKWLFWLFGPLVRHMLNSEGADHARLRGLVQKAFTPRFVEEMRPRIESLTEELLDRVAGQNRMDVIRDYALPLPTTIIAEMLGIPVIERQYFQGLTAALLDSEMGLFEILRAVPTIRAFLRYIRKLVRLRREQPGNDLISALVAAEEAGDKLNEDELLAMIFLLLVAGYETTVNLIGNGTLALLENPRELEKLRAQPSIMPSAIEELLRYDSPLEFASSRWARCEITMRGVTIPRGGLVAAGLAAANRDPRQFAQPDVLDLTREPNRHVSFGLGSHYCLGAPLARLEGQLAFTTLLRRFPELRLAAPRAALRWRKSMVLRGLRALPVSFARSGAAAKCSAS